MHPGSTINAMRKAQGLSLQQLAAMSRTSYSYLSEIENGKRTPTARWLRDVEEALAEGMKGEDA